MNSIRVLSNCVQIIINSPKYGIHIAYIDKKDYNLIKNHNWHLQIRERNKYPLTNIYKNGKRTVLKMHMLLISNQIVDHINGNGLDNRRINLRICSSTQNQGNCRKRKDGKTSKYRGVCKDSHGYGFNAQITIKGKRTHLGFFKKETEAANAYNEAASKYFGNFANLNIIKE